MIVILGIICYSVFCRSWNSRAGVFEFDWPWKCYRGSTSSSFIILQYLCEFLFSTVIHLNHVLQFLSLFIYQATICLNLMWYIHTLDINSLVVKLTKWLCKWQVRKCCVAFGLQEIQQKSLSKTWSYEKLLLFPLPTSTSHLDLISYFVGA